MSRRLKELTKAGRIVIFVSHGLGSVVELCSRSIWKDAGKIVMDGEPSTVVDAYKRSVDELDQVELLRKFSGGNAVASDADGGSISHLDVLQGDMAEPRVAVTVERPLRVRLAGTGTPMLAAPDLVVRILRVDGTLMWEQRLSQAKATDALRGPFVVTLDFEPFLLGANLFRIDAVLVDGAVPIAGRCAVFEVQDETGIAGGRPMIYLSPRLTVRAHTKETAR